LVTYTVPDEPSRIRVATWRAIKKLGAVSLHRSVHVLPDTPRTRLLVRELLRKTEADYKIFVGRPLDPELEAAIVRQGRRDREAEYEEILEKCEDYLRDLRKEVDRHNFTVEEVEENEADYLKLVKWFQEAKSRDWIDLALKDRVAKKLEECRLSFEQFSGRVQEALES